MPISLHLSIQVFSSSLAEDSLASSRTGFSSLHSLEASNNSFSAANFHLYKDSDRLSLNAVT
jgi:hypothetical protein